LKPAYSKLGACYGSHGFYEKMAVGVYYGDTCNNDSGSGASTPAKPESGSSGSDPT